MSIIKICGEPNNADRRRSRGRGRATRRTNLQEGDTEIMSQEFVIPSLNINDVNYDPSERTYKFKFTKPVIINPYMYYQINLKMKEFSDYYYGMSGNQIITGNGNVEFSIYDGFNGSRFDSGLFPDFYYIV